MFWVPGGCPGIKVSEDELRELEDELWEPDEELPELGELEELEELPELEELEEELWELEEELLWDDWESEVTSAVLLTDWFELKWFVEAVEFSWEMEKSPKLVNDKKPTANTIRITKIIMIAFSNLMISPHFQLKLKQKKLLTGLEPATFALRGRHTANCVTVALNKKII